MHGVREKSRRVWYNIYFYVVIMSCFYIHYLSNLYKVTSMKSLSFKSAICSLISFEKVHAFTLIHKSSYDVVIVIS